MKLTRPHRRLPGCRSRAPLTRTVLVLGLGALLLAFAGAHPAEARDGYPKVLNYFLRANVTPSELAQLAKWDVLVLDADFPIETPGGLDALRQLNPDIVVLGYIPINGTFTEAYNRPPETVLYRYWAGMDAGNFWLRSVDGSIVSDWPGKGTANLTPGCLRNAQGQNFWQWFSQFLYDDVLVQGTQGWDGLFLDDVWDNISWLNSGLASPIDGNQDGVPDLAAGLDAGWKAVNDSLVTRLRTLTGPNTIIVSNGANSHYQVLNGTMLENFPGSQNPTPDSPYGTAWNKMMFVSSGAYFNVLDLYNPDPKLLVTINTHWSGSITTPDRTPEFERHKRFTLGSTLLGDGYYSLDATWTDHGALWWEPEYDVHLGDPVGEAYSYTVGGLSIWRRDFTDASVVVNPNTSALSAQAGLPNVGAWDAYIGPRIVDPPPPDTIPPASTPAYWGWPVDAHTGILRWQAVGDDSLSGRASSYLIRQSTDKFESMTAWDTAAVVPNTIVPTWPGAWEQMEIVGLEPSTAYYFAVRTVDDVGNVSPLGPYYFRIITPAETYVDDKPPAAVTDLVAGPVDTLSATLTWTAPGDDGALGQATSYDLRYAQAPITAANFASATPVTPMPSPGVGGVHDGFNLTGLAPGTTYWAALTATDEVGNVSGLSNVASFTTYAPDVTPPGPVTDLHAVIVDTAWVVAGWTAPGDDGSVGTAALYRGRISESPLTEANWSGARTLLFLPLPAAAGTVQLANVDGLVPGTTYYMGLRAEDEGGNLASLGNVLTFTTGSSTPPPPPADTTGPAAVADLAVSGTGANWLTLTWTAPADSGGTVKVYDLRYRVGSTFDPGQWTGAPGVETGAPKAPGTPETVTVTGLSADRTYTFRLISVDAKGNPSGLSNPASGTTPPPPPPVDTLPPVQVTDLTAIAVDPDSGTVRLSWTAPGDDGAVGTASAYDLRWRADALDGSSWDSAQAIPGLPAPAAAGSPESLLVAGLPLDTSLVFGLVAVDEAGNRASLGTADPVRLERVILPDTQPPAAVDGLAAAVREGKVDLRWRAAPEPDLAHYRLYRAWGPGAASRLSLYRDAVGLPEVADGQVVPGREYCYSVTAVDASGNEGPRSPVLAVRVPRENPGHDDLWNFLELGDPYPNPTTGPATVPLETPEAVETLVDIYDVNGRRVRRLADGITGPGRTSLHWDGRDEAGHRVGRGIYFIRVRAGSASWTRKLHVLR